MWGSCDPSRLLSHVGILECSVTILEELGSPIGVLNHRSHNSIPLGRRSTIWRHMGVDHHSLVPTTPYKQLPAQFFLSPQEKYDMKCLGISLFLGGGHFIPYPSLFSFPALCIFHSLGGYFIPCPLYFSFPALRFFIPFGGYFIPSLVPTTFYDKT